MTALLATGVVLGVLSLIGLFLWAVRSMEREMNLLYMERREGL